MFLFLLVVLLVLASGAICRMSLGVKGARTGYSCVNSVISFLAAWMDDGFVAHAAEVLGQASPAQSETPSAQLPNNPVFCCSSVMHAVVFLVLCVCH